MGNLRPFLFLNSWLVFAYSTVRNSRMSKWLFTVPVFPILIVASRRKFSSKKKKKLNWDIILFIYLCVINTGHVAIKSGKPWRMFDGACLILVKNDVYVHLLVFSAIINSGKLCRRSYSVFLLHISSLLYGGGPSSVGSILGRRNTPWKRGEFFPRVGH